MSSSLSSLTLEEKLFLATVSSKELIAIQSFSKELAVLFGPSHREMLSPKKQRKAITASSHSLLFLSEVYESN